MNGRTAAAGTGSPHPTRGVMPIFAGLMLGMLIASLNLTLVAPAMPVIVAQLGGIDHYSWIALASMLASMLASTIVVPIVGRLSDIYGRKPFYMAGIVVFMSGSALAGLAPSFGFLIAARVLTGIGMGAMMPLSQAIIGDIIPPRERGKYQGMMGAVFGFASIVGPVIGGFITHHLSWRWLFFVNVPVGVVTLVVIAVYMHVPHVRRSHLIDYVGIAALTLALVSLLLATDLAGTRFAWGSPQILGLYAFAAAMAAAFVRVEARAHEPLLPLGLWLNSTFTLSNIAIMGVAMCMFGAIYFVPIFVQGVIGDSAANTGTILVPLMLTMVATSIGGGRLVSATGRYKAMILAGLACLGAGFWLLTRMDAHTGNAVVVRNLALVGAGLGFCSQTFTLVVQNAVSREDLGIATAATQLFRSIGAATGVAIMGSLMTHGLAVAVPLHVPPALVASMQAEGLGVNASAVLDPARMARMPAAALAGIRSGLADALHEVYLAGLPFVALSFLAALFLRELPLRGTAHVSLNKQADTSG
jgi:EmrB/QacA subfamily drug resistance transporter